IPPSGPRSAALFPQLAVPDGYRPRGASLAASTAHSKLDCHYAPKAHRRYHQKLAALSMLRQRNRAANADKVYDAVVLIILSARSGALSDERGGARCSRIEFARCCGPCARALRWYSCRRPYLLPQPKHLGLSATCALSYHWGRAAALT